MEVEEGKPEQPWTYKAVGQTIEKDDAVQQSGAPRPRLMVLTSDKGWPYSWREDGSTRDLCVNCEVERVWQIVKGDATEWFSGRPEEHFTPHPRVLIGTPGIGKSVAAGSYLLYQLLHCDAEKLPMVAHFMVSGAYMSDMTTRAVQEYMGESGIVKVVKRLSRRGVRECIVYDAAETANCLSPCLPLEWGMLVTPPETKIYGHWASERRAARIVVDCPDESDAKAMCAWMKRDQPCSSKRNIGTR
ncbi:putative retrotransposon hot spot (RHS) protein [Trypanosoma cruzi]|uniref:Putative retrotransposon hot spot (RHS) protein n=1 Tax=Trypanosoma cruzi TaxID=5693 RepID=A0A2V2UWQ6_TRYCR|nr:putative retrotransposon hot spot (RHS) protein [Trypanosoma cruzi]RNF10005.1 putative retrotransposon hot spot (RHS) protein [Trypanosoma cruzi]